MINKELINILLVKLLIICYTILSLIHELDIIYGVSKIHIVLISLFLFILSSFNKMRINLSSLTYNQIIVLLLFIFIILNSLFIRQYFLTGAIYNLILGYIIAYLIFNMKGSSWYLLIPFLFISIYIIYRLLLDSNPNNVFIRSRNYISFYLIITVLPYYFINIVRDNKVSIITSVICLALSFYSYRSRLVRYILFGTILLISTYVFSRSDFISTADFQRIVNVSQYIELGGRSQFWANYFSNLDFLSFLFGINTESKEILTIGSYTAGHIHSAILNFISVVGIVSFVFFYLILKKIYYIKLNRMYVLILYISLFMRAFTESGALFGYFDFVFWLFLMLHNKYNSIETYRK
jgi:hypothetical protein